MANAASHQMGLTRQRNNRLAYSRSVPCRGVKATAKMAATVGPRPPTRYRSADSGCANTPSLARKTVASDHQDVQVMAKVMTRNSQRRLKVNLSMGIPLFRAPGNAGKNTSKRSTSSDVKRQRATLQLQLGIAAPKNGAPHTEELCMRIQRESWVMRNGSHAY
jgi:hypothetical protein